MARPRLSQEVAALVQAPEETEGTDDDDDDGLALIEGQICQEENKEQSVKD